MSNTIPRGDTTSKFPQSGPALVERYIEEEMARGLSRVEVLENENMRDPAFRNSCALVAHIIDEKVANGQPVDEVLAEGNGDPWWNVDELRKYSYAVSLIPRKSKALPNTLPPVRVSGELLRVIHRAAIETGITTSEAVRQILTAWAATRSAIARGL